MRYQLIGNIAIFNKISKEEAKKILERFPYIKTICIKKGPVKGKLRKPEIAVVISRVRKKKTETIHREHNILYKLDVKKVMFSKGNINERHRIARIARKEETVLDMFAGIGYFTLPLAKKVKAVYAVELNKEAYNYLIENIKLNKLKNVKAFLGDCKEVVPKLKTRFDRIVMGLLPSSLPYFKTALKVSKNKTALHVSLLVRKKSIKEEIKRVMANLKKEAMKENFDVKLLRAVKVKSYSPAFFHFVLDVEVKKLKPKTS